MNAPEIAGDRLSVALRNVAAPAVGRRIEDIGQLGLNVLNGDLPLPTAVLKRSALLHNVRWMRTFTERHGLTLVPHGKTTMSPQLFGLQLAEGAWGITAATAGQVRTYGAFGVRRILMANQLVGAANLRMVFDELRARPDLDFYCLVDSLAGLELLRAELRRAPIGRPLQVLLEVGTYGGRTGIRSLAQALELGRATRAAAPEIVLRGIETYEDVPTIWESERSEGSMQDQLHATKTVAAAGIEEGWFGDGEIILSAGGSAHYDLVTGALAGIRLDRETRVVLRSGCYVTHDELHYAKKEARMRERSPGLFSEGGLRNALEVWSAIQSIPEPGQLICGLGKRDVSHDICLPKPILWFRPGLHRQPVPVPERLRVTRLFDQHAVVDGVGSGLEWKVGDLVAFGIGHPCTTFDKWPLLYTVDDDYAVVGAVRTYF